jgi:putative restriction endonuclease
MAGHGPTRLNIGFLKLVNQAQRAFDAWNVLVDCARNRRTISYGELASAIGIHQRAIRFVLGLIQEHCLIERL